jgi:NADH-quinone oxidoreductase subunit L
MENLATLVPLVIIIPALGAIINYFWGARLNEKWVGIIASTAAALAFVVSLVLLSYLTGNRYEAAVVNPPLLDGWLRIPSIGLEIPWQMRVDTLSVTMMLVVTGVGTLIHIYAVGYMHGDERFSRFFAYLNTFLFFMLILVTGNNLLMMFVGWEGVGLCSFLLIGFWFDKANGVGWRNSNAARKAFIANRVGDFGVLMAIFLTFWTFHTLDFYKPGEISNVALTEEEASHGNVPVNQPIFVNNEHVPTEELGIFGQAERMIAADAIVPLGPFNVDIKTIIGLITLFLLLGATGKSAQIPLFVWLPDAMAGPTPVSALIHAATMVTAGVYMMVRCNVLFANAELTSLLVTVVGFTTAFVGGFIALGQWDIKKVLAYSTVSQLGFMVAAVGVGAYSAAMFHLVTHAFFKGLLFLASGSVIHGVEHGHHAMSHGHDEHDEHDEHAGHHEEFDPQDMRNMGGLRNRMRTTYIVYLIGTLALAGIWPLAGFWSKDEILAESWLAGLTENKLGGYLALGVLIAAAALTAFYMWRQVVLVFHGEPRTEPAAHAEESPRVMTIPLIILAILSIFGGFLNIPAGVGILGLGMQGIFGQSTFTGWLQHSVANAHPGEFQWLIALAAFGLAVTAIALANSIYGRGLVRNRRDPLQVNPSVSTFWSFANAKMYWDETYFRLFENPYNRIATFLADVIDWRFWHDYFHNTILWGGYDAIASLLANGVDLGIIDGAVNGVGRLARWIGGRLRRSQTGYVRTYAVSLLVGVVLVIVLLLLPIFRS